MSINVKPTSSSMGVLKMKPSHDLIDSIQALRLSIRRMLDMSDGSSLSQRRDSLSSNLTQSNRLMTTLLNFPGSRWTISAIKELVCCKSIDMWLSDGPLGPAAYKLSPNGQVQYERSCWLMRSCVLTWMARILSPGHSGSSYNDFRDSSMSAVHFNPSSRLREMAALPWVNHE